MKLWVDDERPAPEGWRRAYDYDQAIILLQSGKVSTLSLDHDLGPDCGGKTGYDIAKFMVDHRYWPKIIFVHSMNPVGRDNILQLLRRYAPYGIYIC